MKFGYRKPSIKKRIAARTSLKRAIRSKTRVRPVPAWIKFRAVLVFFAVK